MNYEESKFLIYIVIRSHLMNYEESKIPDIHCYQAHPMSCEISNCDVFYIYCKDNIGKV